jgi:hypothetical protein
MAVRQSKPLASVAGSAERGPFRSEGKVAKPVATTIGWGATIRLFFRKIANIAK